MKRTLSLILTALLCTLTIPACGEAEPQNAVYVTIANGDLMLAYDAVELSDADGDGALTVNDALYLAHEENYDGGAEAGYANETTDYGLSLAKLWGTDNGGSFGYLVNNVSSMSLTDPVAVGDHVVAYAYTDLAAWSDSYCFFDVTEAAAGEITLTLTMNGYDEAWNAITLPVEGAIITIDGAATDYVTDADGKVTLTAKKGVVISAKSDTMTLVPPVCIVK